MNRLKFGINNIRNVLKDFNESRKRVPFIKEKYNYELLKKVRISVKNHAFDKFIKLQTPNQLGVWNNTAFLSVINPDIDIVLNSPNPYLPLNRDINKNWILHIEPPGYIVKLGLNTDEVLKNFGRVYTSDPQLYEKGGKFIASPPYVHWHLSINSYDNNKDNAVYDYDFLNSYVEVPKKEKSLVSINSSVNDLPGHKLRAEFISDLCKGNVNFDLYGASIWSKYKQFKGPTTNGKWPIYSKYKYVLAIENEVSPYYWTEKFTDAILCYSIPIYYGCTEINKYFPEGSYIPLDIKRKTAIDDLQDILNSDYYEKNLPSLIKARNLILTKHNMFSFFDNEINDNIVY